MYNMRDILHMSNKQVIDKLNSADSTINKLEEKVDDLYKAHNWAIKRIDSLNKLNQELTDRLGNTSTNLENVRKIRDKLVKDNSELAFENSNLKDENKDLLKENAKLKKERRSVEYYSVEKDMAINKLEEKVKRIMAQRDSYINDNMKLIKEYEKQKEELQKENQSHIETNKALHHSDKYLRKISDELLKENKQLKETIEKQRGAYFVDVTKLMEENSKLKFKKIVSRETFFSNEPFVIIPKEKPKVVIKMEDFIKLSDYKLEQIMIQGGFIIE